MNNSLARR
jgi:palmitoyltransferase ZDHHC13/17